MPELLFRCNDLTPDIEYVEVSLLDQTFFGTGEFRFRIRGGTADREIRPNIFNDPVFQASALVKGREFQVLLGRKDNMPPTSGRQYRIPEGVSLAQPHDFRVRFADWQLTAASVDDTP